MQRRPLTYILAIVGFVALVVLATALPSIPRNCTDSVVMTLFACEGRF